MIDRAPSDTFDTVFVGAGDIVHSLGTRSHLLNLFAARRSRGMGVHAVFLQSYLPDLEDDEASVFNVSDVQLLSFRHPFLWRLLPRVAFRVIEKILGLLRVTLLLPILRRAKCLLTTGDLYPFVPLLNRWLPPITYLKFGVAEELELSQDRFARLRAWWDTFAERRMLAGVGRVVVVSDAMRRYVMERSHVPAERVAVLPCLVDLTCFQYDIHERAHLRRQRAWEERVVFAYVGIAAPWQCIDEMVAAFRLVRRLEPRAFLWVISPEISSFKSHLESLPAADYRLETLPHSKLGQVLQAADCGFLLRKRSLVNAVSCPLKFAEYLASGVPVLIGPEVGDCSPLTVAEDVGMLFDPDDPGSWEAVLRPWCSRLKSERTAWGQRCRSVAERSLSWQGIARDLPALLGIPAAHHEAAIMLKG